MALEETLRRVKETQKNLSATTEGVERARDDYSELGEEIRKAKGRLSYKKSTRHADTYARNVIKAMKTEGILKMLLMKEIDDAVTRAGKEFQENQEFYTSKLYGVADNEDVFLMVPLGAGWGTTVSPQIVFEHAGSLNDYAKGIKAYRQSLKTKVGAEGSGRGVRATSWWYRHVYGNETLYTRTLEGRVSASARPAPFWSLIAHGSVSMSSDRPDGSYNPLPARGVNFVINAEEAIKARFNLLLRKERLEWEKETRLFEEEIRSAERHHRQLLEALDKLTTEYQKNVITLRRFGDLGRYVDEDLLAKAARRLRAGEEFESKTITLSAPGERVVRTRVETLRGRLEY